MWTVTKINVCWACCDPAPNGFPYNVTETKMGTSHSVKKPACNMGSDLQC